MKTTRTFSVPSHFMTQEGIKTVNDVAKKQLETLRQKREERNVREETAKAWGFTKESK